MTTYTKHMKAQDMMEVIQERKIKMTDRDFRRIYDTADAEGLAALNACVPVPMVVQEHANMLDDNSPAVKQWIVPGGVCGFAWVNIKPGTNKFCNWLKTTGLAKRDEYNGGITIWVHHGGQSMQIKEAYAHAFARVIREAIPELRVYAMSRMD